MSKTRVSALLLRSSALRRWIPRCTPHPLPATGSRGFICGSPTSGRNRTFAGISGRFILADESGVQHSKLASTDAAGGPLPDLLTSISLAPGQSISGWVYFEMNIKYTPDMFEFSPAGFAVTGTWGVSSPHAREGSPFEEVLGVRGHCAHATGVEVTPRLRDHQVAVWMPGTAVLAVDRSLAAQPVLEVCSVAHHCQSPPFVH